MIHLKAAASSHRSKKAKVVPKALLEDRLHYHPSYLLYCLTMRKGYQITRGNSCHLQGLRFQIVEISNPRIAQQQLMERAFIDGKVPLFLVIAKT